MGHLDEALDDYAELPPNYLNQNPSVTSELLTGLYAGGYYKELVNVGLGFGARDRSRSVW